MELIPSFLISGGTFVTVRFSMSSCHRLESWPSSGGSSRIPALLLSPKTHTHQCYITEKKLTLVWLTAALLLNTANISLILDSVGWSIWTEITDLLVKEEWWKNAGSSRKYESICKTAANSWIRTDFIPTVPKAWNGQPSWGFLLSLYSTIYLSS